jgi:2-isopropylmalate synthase
VDDLTTTSVAGQAPRIVLYDTTLRDGAQAQGVDFSTLDKQVIAAELDRLGIDYIEAGWPGANPTDDAFFANPPWLGHARLTAFGTTRRPGRSTGNDPSLSAVLGAGTQAVCLVGKASDLAAELALGVTPAENLDLIGSAVAEAAGRGREVLFDAEHFFDGYLRNPGYALSCLRRAQQAGAAWLVLCDTNGGTLPRQICSIVGAVAAAMPGAAIGIHLHNDTETAVAGSIAAVAAGARMIHGTLNGMGERCGNANLITLIPTLMLKLGYRTGVNDEGLRRLTEISRMLDARLNRVPNRQAAYVGENAFAHKAGLHAAAVKRDSSTYEHVAPASVGNARHILISNQAGRANLVNRLADFGILLPPDDPRIAMLVETVKQREFEGFVYDGAEASFELLARSITAEMPTLFRVVSLRIAEERSWNPKNELVFVCQAVLEVEVMGQSQTTVATGVDTFEALNEALRKALLPDFPVLNTMRLGGRQARNLIMQEGGAPVTRVIVECHDVDMPMPGRWRTIGVSVDPVNAALSALCDSINYRILHSRHQALRRVS